MKIQFEKIEVALNSAFKGGDGVFAVKTAGDNDCKIMQGRLDKGCSIGMHRHEGTAEVIYVISGEGVMDCDGCEEILRAGDAHYCPEGHCHSFRNDKDAPLVFFAVVPDLKTR